MIIITLWPRAMVGMVIESAGVKASGVLTFELPAFCGDFLKNKNKAKKFRE
jgi:hypothetical protein